MFVKILYLPLVEAYPLVKIGYIVYWLDCIVQEDGDFYLLPIFLVEGISHVVTDPFPEA